MQSEGKIIPVYALKAYWGVEVWLHSFLISMLDGYELSASLPCRFNPEENLL